MEIKQTIGAVEAILFASGEPVELTRLSQTLSVEEDVLYRLIINMKDRYDSEESGIELVELDGAFQLCTKDKYAEDIKACLDIKRNMPLSNAAMETLAIIAYNQPVTKSFIEQIRGVDSGQTVNSLAEKGLVEEAGRLDLPGRPIAYKTTVGFLRCFGMKNLDGLPPLPDDSGQVMLDELSQSGEEE